MAEGGIPSEGSSSQVSVNEGEGALKIFRDAQKQMEAQGLPTSDTPTDAAATKRILEDKRLAQESRGQVEDWPPPIDTSRLKDLVKEPLTQEQAQAAFSGLVHSWIEMKKAELHSRIPDSFKKSTSAIRDSLTDPMRVLVDLPTPLSPEDVIKLIGTMQGKGVINEEGAEKIIKQTTTPETPGEIPQK